MHQGCLQRFLYQFFELISPSDAKVALIVAAPLSAPLFWKFNFSKIWTHMLLCLKTDCSYTHFSFLYVQTSSNIKKNEILWLDLNHSSIQNLAQVARNRDFLQPQATHCRIGSKWDMTFILHSYETSSLIFSHFAHYRNGGRKVRTLYM